jgi:hypothetical protein
MLDTYGIIKVLRLTQARHYDGASNLLYYTPSRFTCLCESEQPHSAVNRVFACQEKTMRRITTPLSKTCPTCGDVFLVPPGDTYRHYCSVACYRNVESRFWERVNKTDGCWEWQGYLTHGYGTFRYEGRHQGAHRVSYAMAYGNPGSLQVLHHCDNRRCVRPDHLFLGTNTDNVADKMAKNRQARGQRVPVGEKHPQHKLSQEQVNEIRRRYAMGGITYKQLSEEFGVCLAQIGHIITGYSWKH